MKTTIVLISKAGLSTAMRISREMPSVELVSSLEIDGCKHVESYESYLSENFSKVDALIFIGAMGICVRLIAPFIADKYHDPAVVCVDTTGKYAIPVLSGHIGGANDLAADISRILGAEAVVTTQSDRLGLWALDTIGGSNGWESVPSFPGIADAHEAMNRIISLFVNGEPTLLVVDVEMPGVDKLLRTAPEHVTVAYGLDDTIDLDSYRLMILISPYLHDNLNLPSLRFVPKVCSVGIGLAHQASPVDDIIDSFHREIGDAGIDCRSIKEFATIDLKGDEPVVKRLQELGESVRFYTADELKLVDVPTPSDLVASHVGTPSVSEASAILASDGGDLLLAKRKGLNYTLAVAVPMGVARRRGHIEIVGAGPGDPDLVSVRGRRMLERADLILYAGSLVPKELTLCAKPGAVVRSSASMNLEEQFALMKEFYDRGKFIVRLHTGDPCIYGAIEEQMNYFDQYGMDYHITPGISSFQAAAAELKSQFTIPERVQSIILTRGEGRTPMPEREKLHLMARSRSTMCIFLSASIADKVQEELLQEYPAETPVAVCYHLTWRDQRIWRGELKDLASIVKDNNITLTTMIVVGDAIGNREGLSRLYADEFKHLFRR